MNKLQKKIIRWFLVGLSIISLLLVIILTPCMTEVEWSNQSVDKHSLEITLMVLLPILLSIIFYLLSEKFISRSLQDAKNKLEWLYDNNFIDVEKYIELLRYLDEADEKRLNAKLQAKVKKEIALINSKKEAQEKILKAQQEAQEEINNIKEEKENIEENKKNDEINYNYV